MSGEINYQALVQDALRGVVRDLLRKAATEGLPGGHHFFVAFQTKAPGVVVPPFLADRFPEEMSIVLQHQFWDLDVGDEEFSVTLAFGAVRHRVTIPFMALNSFVDPAAKFGLKFEPEDEPAELEEGSEEGDDGQGSADPKAPVVSLDRFRRQRD